ncbi:MAG: PPC domain-containing DNA-binding protein [Desulfosudaceae bacterium]
MKYSEASAGRVFVVRLEDGDIVHECIERFAAENGIRAASLVMLGGADQGSRFVVGPEQGRAEPVVPMTRMLENVHEAAGVGTIFPDASGRPVLHMHMACGRQGETVTGCVRAGVCVWHVMEAVVWELTETRARRLHDDKTGFALLAP